MIENAWLTVYALNPAYTILCGNIQNYMTYQSTIFTERFHKLNKFSMGHTISMIKNTIESESGATSRQDSDTHAMVRIHLNIHREHEAMVRKINLVGGYRGLLIEG